MDYDPIKIYKAFQLEWCNNLYDYKDWISFIETKDLGIKCIKAADFPKDDKYKIINEQKWFLAKLKYGI